MIIISPISPREKRPPNIRHESNQKLKDDPTSEANNAITIELETTALSIPRNAEQRSSRRYEKDANKEFDDVTTVSSSSGSICVGQNRQSSLQSSLQSSPVVVTAQNNRRKFDEGKNKVAVYNVMPKSNLQRSQFAGQMKRRIWESRNVKVEVVKCKLVPHKDEAVTVLITFRDRDETRLALSLDGIKYAKRTLHAKCLTQHLG